jgi:hypothetical protein
MRDYAKVSPQFWIGTTGKALRAAGLEAQLVALYLLTNPHANMLGLYYLPRVFIAHESGLPSRGASKGLTRCIDAQFCSYDAITEVVWVHEMAAYQVGEQLTQADKRCLGIQNEYNSLPENPFLEPFFARYVDAFHLSKVRVFSPVKTSSNGGASEPHRSHEHEHEHEQEHESPSASATPTRVKVPRETLADEDPDWLLEFKLAYPNRAGDQGWRKAVRAAHARIAQGHTTAEFIAGAKRYCAFCDASGKTGTEFVKQACTFLGPDKHFLAPWDPSPTKAEQRLNANIDGAREWLAQSGGST